MGSIQEIALQARRACGELAASALETRNTALIRISEALFRRREPIFEANRQDMLLARKNHLAAPMLSRLRFDDAKMDRVIDGLKALAGLPDPLGHVSYAKELCQGQRLYRVSCPIGVIGTIFESRPDALVQIASLCLKSGNAVLLKGGSEAMLTNEALHQAIAEGSREAGMPEGWSALLHSRQDVAEMLKQDEYIDLIIPRGSNAFVRYIMQNSTIPVLGHSDGICHVYVDRYCDIDMAVRITVDSKTQSLAVCNAMETLLVHAEVAPAFLPLAAAALSAKGVELRGCERTRRLIDCKPAVDADWSTEYLDAILSIRVVDSLDEAIEHINQYGSGHTDCILSTDEAAIERFMMLVDSADVFSNCSTRFSDGFVFGLGAEVGIATGKLHARGPMGLDGLCTYKYKLYGSGETMADVISGKTPLVHRDLKA